MGTRTSVSGIGRKSQGSKSAQMKSQNDKIVLVRKSSTSDRSGCDAYWAAASVSQGRGYVPRSLVVVYWLVEEGLTHGGTGRGGGSLA